MKSELHKVPSEFQISKPFSRKTPGPKTRGTHCNSYYFSILQPMGDRHVDPLNIDEESRAAPEHLQPASLVEENGSSKPKPIHLSEFPTTLFHVSDDQEQNETDDQETSNPPGWLEVTRENLRAIMKNPASLEKLDEQEEMTRMPIKFIEVRRYKINCLDPVKAHTPVTERFNLDDWKITKNIAIPRLVALCHSLV